MGKEWRPPTSPSPPPSPSRGAELSSLIDREPARGAAPAFLASFGEAIEGYLRELTRRGKAPGTIALYRSRLLQLGRFLGGRPGRPLVHLSDITAKDVAAFRDHEIGRPRRKQTKRVGGAGCDVEAGERAEAPLSASTVYLIVTILRGFFRHLVRGGVLLLDPAADLMGPRRSKRLPREVPTARQMRKLLQAPNAESPLGKRDSAVLELLYSSGLRNAELCGLSLGDIDVKRRTVFVRKGKGGQERLVPMGRKAAQALSLYLTVYPKLPGVVRAVEAARAKGRGRVKEAKQAKEAKAVKERDASPPLFLHRGGGRLDTNGVRRIVARCLRKANVRVKATPHSLRHACATHLLRGGAGIRQIQTLLGHASLESTQIYTKVETSDLRAMLDRHHPRGREKAGGRGEVDEGEERGA